MVVLIEVCSSGTSTVWAGKACTCVGVDSVRAIMYYMCLIRLRRHARMYFNVAQSCIPLCCAVIALLVQSWECTCVWASC